MNEHLPEADWKKIRGLKPAALQTACNEVFEKLSAVMESRGADSHKAYLRLWKILKQEDKKIRLMFDDLKRNTAILKLAEWHRNGILSDEELKAFTEETQNRLKIICSI